MMETLQPATVGAILDSTFRALLLPLQPVADTLIYYDLRIRSEGLDIEMMMRRAGMNSTAAVPGPDDPAEETRTKEQPA